MVTVSEDAQVPRVKQTTVRLDPKMWVRFRMILLRRNESTQKVLEDLVTRYVEYHEKEGK